VELKQAWRVLGIDPSDDPDEVRAAYTRRLFELHPDHSSAPDANEATVELNAAYRDVVTELERPSHIEAARETAPRGAQPGAPARAVVAVAKLADDTIGVGAPGPETFAVLLDACHRLGEVTYVEPGSGMIQVLVEFLDGPVCQLLLTLQGRATGVTEAFCTIESIDDRPAPPIDAVTDLLVHTLTAP
jgi:hypothetical protein